MRTRAALPALALVLAAACDGTITEPSFMHLTSISMTAGYACGLDGGGRAYCWGENGVGQLGTGDNASSTSPIPAKTDLRFTQIFAGRTHVCALATDGRAVCWGGNASSQLGVTTVDLDCNLLQSNGWIQDFGNGCSVDPVPVQTGLRFTRLGVYDDASCGLTGSGQIWCWGSGLLGDSAGITESDTLVRVSAPARFTTFTVGNYHTCAADTEGLGWCWGNNYSGELGLGVAGSTITFSSTPVRINSSAFIKGFALGQLHTCAVTGGHDVLCWGAGASGQRGDSSTTATMHDPTFVKTDRKFTSLAAAGYGTCALEAGTGHAWCWGENSTGALGDGTTSDRSGPAPVLGGLMFKSIAMTANGYPYVTTTCGTSGDTMYCWGLLPQPLTFGE